MRKGLHFLGLLIGKDLEIDTNSLIHECHVSQLSHTGKKYLKVIFEYLTDDEADFPNKGFNFILKIVINKHQTRLNYYNIKLCCKYNVTMKKGLEFNRTQFELQFASQYSCEIKSNYLFNLGLSFFHLTHRFC